jgi:hypothetical protein
MPDQTPAPQPEQPTQSTPPAAPSGPTIHIGDEFGTAKRNLPPVKILLLATAGILIIVGIYSFSNRAKPQAGGTLDNVVAVDLPGQNSVLAAFTFTLRNSGEKTLWVHDIKGKIAGPSGEQDSEAVSAMDFDRYFQGFPALKNGAQPALAPEDKLQPGQEVKRTVMIGFPVNLEAFNQRRSVSVIIQPYDQPLPVVLTK